MKIIAILTTFIVLLLGCKTTEQYYAGKGYREIVGDELMQLISGKIVDSGNWQSNYYENGELDGVARGVYSFTGTWKITPEGKLCVSSSNQYTDGCKSIYSKDGENAYVWISHETASVKITPIKK